MPGLLDGVALVDGHCHLLLAGPVDRATFERCCTEANRPGPDRWDTPVGLAIRRWCPPVLGLGAFATPADYLDRRAELGVEEVAGRLLRAANLARLLVDTGLGGPGLAGLDALATAAGAPVDEVVRLERVAEDLAAGGVGAGEFAAAVVDALGARAAGAVAVKSVVAYRHGLDVDPARPSAAEVRTAAGEWLAGAGAGAGAAPRLDHPVLLRFLLWAGIDTGLPLQIHTGFGDRELRLDRADPARLQPWLAAVEPAGVPVVLLHCYPFHRSAGWLAAVYPHVYVDVGLTVGQVGARAGAVLGECLELAPFAKLLFSTDGYRLPELYLVGAAQFRRGFDLLLGAWVAEGALGLADARRIAGLVAAGNAEGLYRASRP